MVKKVKIALLPERLLDGMSTGSGHSLFTYDQNCLPEEILDIIQSGDKTTTTTKSLITFY